MKVTLYLSLFTASAVSIQANAQLTVVDQTTNSTSIDFNLGAFSLQSKSTGSHFVLDEETSKILELGAPDLGKYSYTLVLPPSGTPEVSVQEGEFVEYTNITIDPSKGSLKRNINPADVPFTYGEAYSKNEFYPAKRAAVYEPFLFRSVRGVAVHVFPYAYNPVTKVLRVYKNLKVTVTTDDSKTGVNTIMTNNFEEGFENIYENLFVNYNQMNPGQRYTALSEKGAMLIITQPSCTTALAPLITWKEQRGIEVEMVTTATSGTSQSAIKSYITSYHGSHPNLKFVLLVGDHEQLAAYNAGSTGWETKWSDSKYAMTVGTDNYPDVLIGRLPAKNSTHCTSMVTKIVEYEKTPSSGTWYTNSIGIGSDEGAGIGDDGEADWQHMRNIRTELMGFGYTTVNEFYDGSHGGADASGNPSATMVATAVNNGASLFLYCGHGDLTSCVTSNYSVTQVQAATNYGKYPFVISVACNNGTFAGGDCLTEEFMRASNTGGPTGAIGAAGSSILMAWAEPMETEDEMSKILSGISPGNLKYTLGGLFYNGQMSMLADYPSSTGIEVMETWVLFGDPSTMMRSKVPSTMTVTNPSCYTNGSPFTVSGGITGADVAMTQGTDILSTGTITAGTANLNFTGVTGSVTLTVTGYNQLPYIVTVPQCATGIEEMVETSISVYPNPAADVIYIENGNGLSYNISDALGKMIVSGTYGSSINVSEFSKGLYFVKVTDRNNKVTTVRFVKK